MPSVAILAQALFAQVGAARAPLPPYAQRSSLKKAARLPSMAYRLFAELPCVELAATALAALDCLESSPILEAMKVTLRRRIEELTRPLWQDHLRS